MNSDPVRFKRSLNAKWTKKFFYSLVKITRYFEIKNEILLKR